MQVTKQNRIHVYKGREGKLDIYINVEGKQFRTTAFPNIEEDLSIRSWGGNLHDNTVEVES